MSPPLPPERGNGADDSLSCREFRARALACISFGHQKELSSRGALLLPSRDLRDLLLRSYFHWVHPLIPVLELPYLLQRLLRDDDRDFPHPFLYHAVLYAGSSFVDPFQLREAGFPSRQHICSVLRERARILDALTPERNPILKAQGLLLLSTRQSLSETSLIESRTWIRQSLRVATESSLLGKTIDPKGPLSTISSSLRDRIVWSLYTADLTISLALDTPFQIRQLPTMTSQFVPDPFSTANHARIIASITEPDSNIFDPTYHAQLCQILSERSKLIRYIYTLLNTPSLGRKALLALENTVKTGFLLTHMKKLDLPTINTAEKVLTTWLNELPLSARYDALWTIIQPRRHSTEFVMCVHRAAMHILCLTFLLALHSTRIFRGARTDALIQRTRQLASEIVQTWADLAALDAIPFLPSFAVLSLNLAKGVFLRDEQLAEGADNWSAKLAVRSCDRFLDLGL